jgi:hypothetical protein
MHQVPSVRVSWVIGRNPLGAISSRLIHARSPPNRDQTAAIMQRIAGTDELPEAQRDEALAAVDRVILAISVERVSAITHL